MMEVKIDPEGIAPDSDPVSHLILISPLSGSIFVPLQYRRMPSTYLDLNYHLVFSTKNRQPLIHMNWRSDIHGYLGGVVNGLGGVPLNINGVNDHVHLLVGLRSTHCLADFMRELKKASSKWARNQCANNFEWQKGYAAFTVSASMKNTVFKYICRQEEHHKVRSFKEELIVMLRRADLRYDPKFLD